MASPAGSAAAISVPRPGEVKGHGIHYTPPELADFLARRIVAQLDLTKPELTVLDPACGEGEAHAVSRD
jgi:type I restriction-modification system DNA methylase subunit